MGFQQMVRRRHHAFLHRVLVVLGASAGLALAEGAAAQAGKFVINVKDSHTYNMVTYPGASGDGSTDDTSAIQGKITLALIDGARGGDGALIFFPEGIYRITDTIVVPPCTSLDFSGAAAAAFEVGGIEHAIIAADFDESAGPMIYSRASHTRWTDFQLVLHDEKSSNTPECIFKTDEGSPSQCVSTVTFENVHFDSEKYGQGGPLGVGVVLGSANDDFCSSEFNFYRCGFVGLEKGIHIKTFQSVDHVLEQVHAINCLTFLDMDEGGNLSFNIGNFSGCGDANNWIFDIGGGGPNPGPVSIRNAHFESGSKKIMRVDGMHQVLMESCVETTNGGSTAVLQVNAGSVVVSNCMFQSFPVLNFSSSSSYSWVDKTVRFRDCSFPVVAPAAEPPAPPKGGDTDPPPSGLITGTGKWVYLNCTGLYDGLVYYPFENDTNVTGW